MILAFLRAEIESPAYQGNLLRIEWARPVIDSDNPDSDEENADEAPSVRQGAYESGVVREQDLGDAIRLVKRGEVSSVGKRDRARASASNQFKVGFTLRHARPIAFAIDEGDGDADATVERS
jgi:hypothetical protein